jgi:hypothetical protein
MINGFPEITLVGHGGSHKSRKSHKSKKSKHSKKSRRC